MKDRICLLQLRKQKIRAAGHLVRLVCEARRERQLGAFLRWREQGLSRPSDLLLERVCGQRRGLFFTCESEQRALYQREILRRKAARRESQRHSARLKAAATVMHGTIRARNRRFLGFCFWKLHEWWADSGVFSSKATLASGRSSKQSALSGGGDSAQDGGRGLDGGRGKKQSNPGSSAHSGSSPTDSYSNLLKDFGVKAKHTTRNAEKKAKSPLRPVPEEGRKGSRPPSPALATQPDARGFASPEGPNRAKALAKHFESSAKKSSAPVASAKREQPGNDDDANTLLSRENARVVATTGTQGGVLHAVAPPALELSECEAQYRGVYVENESETWENLPVYRSHGNVIYWSSMEQAWWLGQKAHFNDNARTNELGLPDDPDRGTSSARRTCSTSSRWCSWIRLGRRT